MKQRFSSHVGNGDCDHKQQTSNHEALRPSFQHQAIWVSRAMDGVILISFDVHPVRQPLLLDVKPDSTRR